MKVVACENCGAKYQLDDDEVISDYECSSCTGNLEYLENYPFNMDLSDFNNELIENKDNYQDSGLVYCSICGLKYKLDETENIMDYECSSCFGNLLYINKELNKGVDIEQDNHLANNFSGKMNFKNEVGSNNKETDELNSSKVVIIPDIVRSTRLRESAKKGFLNNVDKEYIKHGIEISTDNKFKSENTSSFQIDTTSEDIEKIIRKKIEEKNTQRSIFDRISSLGRTSKSKNEKDILKDNKKGFSSETIAKKGRKTEKNMNEHLNDEKLANKENSNENLVVND